MATMPSLPQKRLVVLEESVLASMAGNRLFLAEFPFLGQLSRLKGSASKPGCGSCRGRQITHQRIAAISTLKQTIAGMGDDKKRRLKELLNTQQVQLRFRAGNRIIEHTF